MGRGRRRGLVVVMAEARRGRRDRVECRGSSGFVGLQGKREKKGSDLAWETDVEGVWGNGWGQLGSQTREIVQMVVGGVVGCL